MRPNDQDKDNIDKEDNKKNNNLELKITKIKMKQDLENNKKNNITNKEEKDFSKNKGKRQKFFKKNKKCRIDSPILTKFS